MGTMFIEYRQIIFALDFFAKKIAASKALSELSEPSNGTRIFLNVNNDHSFHFLYINEDEIIRFEFQL